MPRNIIHKAVTERLEILDKDGQIDAKLMPKLTPKTMIEMYRLMNLMRTFDDKALNLQRQGRIGTYGSLRGQEAAQAGLALLIDSKDWIIPSFREHGIMMAMGVPLHLIYSYWKGDERGNRLPEGIRCFPPAVPVGSQLVHAAGVGLALKLQNDPAVAMGFVGDGGSSEGDFHEALNMAGVFKSRTLFYVQNNQWAISIPFKKQTAAASIAQRAHNYGFPGIQVDGNDVFAVYSAAMVALKHIRAGKGPYLIEALTYRMGDHTTADDQTKYRTAEDVAYWQERDPIDRLKTYLVKQKLWDDSKEAAMSEQLTQQIEKEVKVLESMPAPNPLDIFDYMYETLPPHLLEQRQAFEKRIRS